MEFFAVMSLRPCFALIFIALLLPGCASDPATRSEPAPIEKRTGPGARPPVARTVRAVNREPDTRPRSYTVAKGDTLYAIALEYGFDYRELAQWNGLADPNVINVGQELRLTAPAEPAPATVVVQPLVQKKPLQVVPDLVSTGPKALKLPWSDTALAELDRQLKASPPVSPPVVMAATAGQPTNGSEKAPAGGEKGAPAAEKTPAQGDKPAVAPDKPPVQTERPEAKTGTPLAQKGENDGPTDDEGLEWVYPTQGKLLSGYNEKGNKGWDIGGKKGQAVFSASVGKVVYSGTGLRGYGKLIIIKHNKTYLTAYAHNQTILVKEGDNVAKGQKIAEMGDTDSDTVKLHFEIRRFGKPVDPSKYMPAETKP